MRKVITAIALLLAVLLAACSGTRSTPENVAQELGVSLPETVSVGYEDTHGGFHGDGETFVTLTFSVDDAAALQAQLAEQGWQLLPMEGGKRLVLVLRPPQRRRRPAQRGRAAGACIAQFHRRRVRRGPECAVLLRTRYLMRAQRSERIAFSEQKNLQCTGKCDILCTLSKK